MKSALIVLFAFLLVPLARGQYTNWFLVGGGLPTHFDVQTPDGSRLNYPRGSTPFRFGLYVGPTNALERDLELVCLFTNQPLTVLLMWRLPPGLLSFRSTKYAPEAMVSVQVRGWSMELGMSYEEALQNDTAAAGFFGQTTIINMKPVRPGNAPPVLFGRNSGQLDFFVMKPRPQ